MRYDLLNPKPIPKDQYLIEGTDKVPEALGFLKDWVTSVLQIETAVLGAIGAATVLKNEPDIRLTHLQLGSIGLASVFFGISIICGTMLLNMLPGAVQRKPRTEQAKHDDIYSITTASRMRIYDWAGWFRLTFQFGIACIPVFILARALRM
jgi:hypothetical protein